jgi:hypothetical protein
MLSGPTSGFEDSEVAIVCRGEDEGIAYASKEGKPDSDAGKRAGRRAHVARALPLSNHASAASRARPLGHYVSRQRQNSVKSMLSLVHSSWRAEAQRALFNEHCVRIGARRQVAAFATRIGPSLRQHIRTMRIDMVISRKKLHAHHWKLRLGRVEVDHQGPARGHTVVQAGSPGEPRIVCQRTHILPNNVLRDTAPTGVSSLPGLPGV